MKEMRSSPSLVHCRLKLISPESSNDSDQHRPGEVALDEEGKPIVAM
jgi:hypothetical protein